MIESRHGHSNAPQEASPAVGRASSSQPTRPGRRSLDGAPGFADPNRMAAGSLPGAGTHPLSDPVGASRPARAAFEPADTGPPIPYRPADADQPPAPRHKPNKKLRLLVLIALAALTIGVAAVSAIGTKLDNRRSEETLTRLLTALKSADTATAVNLIDMSRFDTTNQPMLGADALARNAGNFDFNPEFVRRGSSSAPRYQATVRLNGTDKVVEWGLTKLHGDWLVDGTDVVTKLAIAEDHPHIINDIQIAPGTTSLLLLPGSYQVAAGMKLLEYNPASSAFDLYTGGEATFQSQLQPAEGVAEAVREEIRNQLNACAVDRSAPTACNWPIKFDNGELTNGTLVWQLEPADPAAGFVLPANFSAGNHYVATGTLHYETLVSGTGIVWEKRAPGNIENARFKRTSYIEVDLSGETPVVKIG